MKSAAQIQIGARRTPTRTRATTPTTRSASAGTQSSGLLPNERVQKKPSPSRNDIVPGTLPCASFAPSVAGSGEPKYAQANRYQGKTKARYRATANFGFWILDFGLENSARAGIALESVAA